MAEDPRPLPRARPGAQPVRAADHGSAVLRPLGDHAALPRLRLLAEPAARRAGRRLHGPAVHDPARLRPRLVLPHPARQPRRRPRPRGADAHPLRLLAAHARDAPREFGQSRSPRQGRRADADGRRIPEPAALAPDRLPALPQPLDPAGAGPDLPVLPQASPADRADGRRQGGLDQRDGDQSRHRRHRRRHERFDRRPGFPLDPPADHAARLLDRGLAVLRPAPVRGDLLGPAGRLDLPGRRDAGQHVFRPAGAAPLVQRQHRRPPCPSPGEPDSRAIG